MRYDDVHLGDTVMTHRVGYSGLQPATVTAKLGRWQTSMYVTVEFEDRQTAGCRARSLTSVEEYQRSQHEHQERLERLNDICARLNGTFGGSVRVISTTKANVTVGFDAGTLQRIEQQQNIKLLASGRDRADLMGLTGAEARSVLESHERKLRRVGRRLLAATSVRQYMPAASPDTSRWDLAEVSAFYAATVALVAVEDLDFGVLADRLVAPSDTTAGDDLADVLMA